MNTGITQFVLNIPEAEEDMRAVINEIIRLHSDKAPYKRVSRERFIAVRDNLQFLVDMMNDRLKLPKEKK